MRNSKHDWWHSSINAGNRLADHFQEMPGIDPHAKLSWAWGLLMPVQDYRSKKPKLGERVFIADGALCDWRGRDW